jgi:hypothetical protein
MRLLTCLLLSFILTAQVPAFAQGSKRKPVKSVKKGWKKSGSSYNPYLEKKAKNKPSARLARQDQKELQRQKKAARKQMRRSKRSLNK